MPVLLVGTGARPLALADNAKQKARRPSGIIMPLGTTSAEMAKTQKGKKRTKKPKAERVARLLLN